MKAAVGPGAMGDPAWAGSVAEYQLAVTAFAETLAQVSVFDTLLTGGMRRVPLRSKGVAIITGATASEVGESGVKPLSQLALDSITLDPRKVMAAVILSRELALSRRRPRSSCSTPSWWRRPRRPLPPVRRLPTS